MKDSDEKEVKALLPKLPPPAVMPQNAVPLDGEHFVKAFDAVQEFCTQPNPLSEDQLPIFTIHEENGSPAIYQARDTKMLRAVIALRAWYDQYEVHNSAVWRLFALCTILRNHRRPPWIGSGGHDSRGEFTTAHRAVILAAAQCRLTPQGEFEVGRFFRMVRNIAAQIEGEPMEATQ